MEGKYLPTIGLEIHAELSTRTKMFCGCLNDSEERLPNVNICPVCMAHPGTLPVINKEAVHKVLQVGVALGGKLPDATWFDRKNYFYPDIPKGYQISQYKDPLVSGGSLALPAVASAKAGRVAITRVHLEEDTAKSSHIGEGSLIDFNRAGVALMELVTEPVIHDADTAGNFARELQLMLRYLGASEANMEMGQMRVEANISVASAAEINKKDGEPVLGTKVEVKNLNSFRSVERAITYEVERQIALIESGGSVVQETRGWDEGKSLTFSQRKKESSHDYRYFPEPDLPQLRLSAIPEFSRATLEAELPELPVERRERYRSVGLKAETGELFVANTILGNFFDEVALHLDDAEKMLASNYTASDIAGKLESRDMSEVWLTDAVNAARFAELIQLVATNKLSSRGAKDTLSLMLTSTDAAESIAKAHNLIQESDMSALEPIAKKIVDANPVVAEEVRSGKTAALQFLIGQGMKESRGSANPVELKKIFESLLS